MSTCCCFDDYAHSQTCLLHKTLIHLFLLPNVYIKAEKVTDLIQSKHIICRGLALLHKELTSGLAIYNNNNHPVEITTKRRHGCKGHSYNVIHI